MSSTGASDVIRKVVDLIRENGLSVGDRLPPVRDLSEKWGIGRNIVREVLQQAQTVGLVRIMPRSGVYVQSVDLSVLTDALATTLETSLGQEAGNVYHIAEARRLIEEQVASEAAAWRRPDDVIPMHEALMALEQSPDDRESYVEADERFHLAIGRAAGNPVLLAVQRTLLTMVRPFRVEIHPGTETRERSDRLHRKIYQTILDGDAETARATMREHLLDQGRRILAHAGAERLRSHAE